MTHELSRETEAILRATYETAVAHRNWRHKMKNKGIELSEEDESMGIILDCVIILYTYFSTGSLPVEGKRLQ